MISSTAAREDLAALPIGSRRPFRKRLEWRSTPTPPAPKLESSRSVGSREATWRLFGIKEEETLRLGMQRSSPFSGRTNDDDNHSI